MSEHDSTTARSPAHDGEPCALIQDLLPLYIEGEVSPRTSSLIAEHLARCEHCAGFLAGAQSVRSQFRRERAQRVDAVNRDQPAQQVVETSKHLLTVIVQVVSVLGLAMIGALLLISFLPLFERIVSRLAFFAFDYLSVPFGMLLAAPALVLISVAGIMLLQRRGR